MTDHSFNQNNATEQPFRVPENYFEQLSARVMDNVKAAEQPSAPTTLHKKIQWHRIAAWTAAAAFVGMVAMTSIRFAGEAGQTSALTDTQLATGNGAPEMEDYVILDNEQIYALVSENY